MEEVRGESALDLIFRSQTGMEDLTALLTMVQSRLNALHKLPVAAIPLDLVQTRDMVDPYTGRLRNKLRALTKLDQKLERIWTSPCEVFGLICSPLEPTLKSIELWLRSQLVTLKPVFLHGDPHLGNIFCRLGAKPKVRFIDPNADACFGDPIYDIGKVLHWIEAVGWAAYKPSLCHARLTNSRGKERIKLASWLSPRTSQAAEQRRQWAEKEFFRIFPVTRTEDKARLFISVATAHAGLALLLAKNRRVAASRFVLAHLLRSISNWAELYG